MSISQCAQVPTLVHESRPSSRGLSRVPAVLPRRTLRQILNRALGTPSQLDAFLIDYFPDIFRQTSGGMDREAKLNLLLQEDSETHLTSLVHREFPQQVADTLVQEKLISVQQQSSSADPDQTLHAPEDEQRVKYTVVVTGTLDDMDRHIVEALLKHMRRYISDAELTIEAIRSGSVILTCTGTKYGLQKLFEDFEQGRLSSLLEFPILDIVQNLPSTQVPQVPQVRARKTLPPLQDSRITARFTWPTVAERIEEHKTVRLQPDPTQVLRIEDQQCCPEPITCGQSYVTRKMKVLPIRRKKKLVLWLLGVAACGGAVLALHQSLLLPTRGDEPHPKPPELRASAMSPTQPDAGIAVAAVCEHSPKCDQSLGIAIARLCLAESSPLHLDGEWQLQRQGTRYAAVSPEGGPPPQPLAQQLAHCLSQHLQLQQTGTLQRWPARILMQGGTEAAMPPVALP